MRVVKAIDVFYKRAQEAVQAILAQNKKPKAAIKDRFHGATGEELQSLLQAEATKLGYAAIVPKQNTPLNEAQLVQGLYKIISGKHPEMANDIKRTLAITLASHIRLETGLKHCYNYNVGNWHATKKWKGKVFVMNDPQKTPTGESYVNLHWFWKAFDSFEEGLRIWYGFIENTYPQAFQAATSGDAYNYGQLLKGYYTENKEKYSLRLKNVRNEIERNVASIPLGQENTSVVV